MNIGVQCKSPLYTKGLSKIIGDYFSNINVIGIKEGRSLRSTFDRYRLRFLIIEVDSEILQDKKFKCILESLIGQYGTKILFLIDQLNVVDLVEYLKIGVHGYINPNTDINNFINSIQKLLNGEYIINLSGEISDLSNNLECLCFNERKEAYYPADLLTKREYEILTLIGRGLSNVEIAKECFISEKTTKNHVSSILCKLSVRDRTSAVVKAYKNNWVCM